MKKALKICGFFAFFVLPFVVFGDAYTDLLQGIKSDLEAGGYWQAVWAMNNQTYTFDLAAYTRSYDGSYDMPLPDRLARINDAIDNLGGLTNITFDTLLHELQDMNAYVSGAGSYSQTLPQALVSVNNSLIAAGDTLTNGFAQEHSDSTYNHEALLDILAAIQGLGSNGSGVDGASVISYLSVYQGYVGENNLCTYLSGFSSYAQSQMRQAMLDALGDTFNTNLFLVPDQRPAIKGGIEDANADFGNAFNQGMLNSESSNVVDDVGVTNVFDGYEHTVEWTSDHRFNTVSDDGAASTASLASMAALSGFGVYEGGLGQGMEDQFGIPTFLVGSNMIFQGKSPLSVSDVSFTNFSAGTAAATLSPDGSSWGNSSAPWWSKFALSAVTNVQNVASNLTGAIGACLIQVSWDRQSVYTFPDYIKLMSYHFDNPGNTNGFDLCPNSTFQFQVDMTKVAGDGVFPRAISAFLSAIVVLMCAFDAFKWLNGQANS